MYQKITRLFLIVVLLTNYAFSQSLTLSGKIIDEENQPIEFANILLKSTINPAWQNGTITDQNGQFKVTIPEKGNYELTISFVGFTDWQKVIDVQQSVDLQFIELKSVVNELSEVVVKGERKIITRKEDKLVFNVATSPLNSGYDGVEVLQRSPNIIVDSEGNILMKNQPPTVMINGRITNLSGADLANYLSNIRSENIKNIEIQTHQSANTDGESTGGVININLKKQPVGLVGAVRAEYTEKGGGFNGDLVGGNFNYGAEKWNIYGVYNRVFRSDESIIFNETDYFATNDRFVTNSIFDRFHTQHNYQLGFVGDLAKNHTIGLEGYATNSQYNFV
ncbi:MAG: TonB-dependent receptor, partial [Bacteroidota bacterium]